MKSCSTCKIEFPYTHFRKEIKHFSGYGSQCRNCRNKAQRAWVSKNYETHSKKVKEYRIKNKDKIKQQRKIYSYEHRAHRAAYYRKWVNENFQHVLEKRKNYYRKNKVKLLQKAKEAKRLWYIANREKVLKRRKELYKQNKEQILAQSKMPNQRAKRITQVRKRYANNPEHFRQISRKYRKEKPEIVRRIDQKKRVKRSQAIGDFSANDIHSILAKQNQKCLFEFENPLCQKDIAVSYHIDHNVPLSRGGSNYSFNIDLLCPKCNMMKRELTVSEFRLRLAGIILPTHKQLYFL